MDFHTVVAELKSALQNKPSFDRICRFKPKQFLLSFFCSIESLYDFFPYVAYGKSGPVTLAFKVGGPFYFSLGII